MGQPSYMRSVVDRNVVMRRIPVFTCILNYCLLNAFCVVCCFLLILHIQTWHLRAGRLDSVDLRQGSGRQGYVDQSPTALTSRVVPCKDPKTFAEHVKIRNWNFLGFLWRSLNPFRSVGCLICRNSFFGLWDAAVVCESSGKPENVLEE